MLRHDCRTDDEIARNYAIQESKWVYLRVARDLGDLPLTVLTVAEVRTLLFPNPDDSIWRESIDRLVTRLRLAEIPNAARLRGILPQEIKAAAAALIEQHLDRVVRERVDAILKEHAESHRQASAVTQEFISQLREKAAGAPLLSPKQAWKRVDFSAVYDEEDEEGD